ncbi:AsmA family protein [Sphingomonas montanisoli]|uniref:AsmA family protein n=1 Tax=Sphingomonas montanisoli TaxID=2606412 RepID=A0A5D9C9W7_9SPHN|nr:AsmA family protein [Sphingomonas montanisoli]
MRIVIASLAAAVAVLLIALAAFPWGLLRGPAERALSRHYGQPARIAVLDRVDRFGFHPIVEARGVRLPQARWAGAGELARIDRVRARFSVWAMLTGRFEPVDATIEGGRIGFARAADGRVNWRDGPKPASSDRRGERPMLEQIRLNDVRITYKDAKRDRDFDVVLNAGSAGLRLSGTGHVKRNPVTLTATGAPIVAGRPWPFRAAIDGPAVAISFVGRMDGPLDINHLTAKATARADDLALVDAIIEAGLMGTQPVRLSAQVRRDRPDWRISGLSGTIGRSDVAGDATIVKRDGRTRIDGRITSRRFAFDDIASDAGLAKAAAKRARFGLRLIPDTAIDLDNVRRTDGRLSVKVDRLMWPGPSPIRSLDAVIMVDRSRLEIAPLRMGLTHGTMAGRITVDQRGGRPPELKVVLDIDRASFADFLPGTIDGPLTGRARVTGRGLTVREAIGRGDGAVALVVREGTIGARTASLLGQDVGRGLTTDKDKQTGLRCMVARLDIRGGTARANPVLIDSHRALTRARGTIDLKTERLAFAVNGAPKGDSLLRLQGTIGARGTIKRPAIELPEKAKSVGGILAMIGDAIADKQEPAATDADCAGAANRALGVH